MRPRLIHTNDRQCSQGFTLLELVLVLVIITALATIAVEMLEPQVDQQRFNAARKTMENVRNAIADPTPRFQPDGTPLISGFVSDIGRLPIANGTDAKTQLNELWNGVEDFAYQIRSGPAPYTDVKLPCGSRAPYLQLPLGKTQLTDPFAKGFEFTLAADNSVTQMHWDAPDSVESLVDLDINFSQSLVTVEGVVTIDGATPTTSSIVLLIPDSTNNMALKVLLDADADQASFRFENIPVGLRAIHATIDGETVIKYFYAIAGGTVLSIQKTTLFDDSSSSETGTDSENGGGT